MPRTSGYQRQVGKRVSKLRAVVVHRLSSIVDTDASLAQMQKHVMQIKTEMTQLCVINVGFTQLNTVVGKPA